MNSWLRMNRLKHQKYNQRRNIDHNKERNKTILLCGAVLNRVCVLCMLKRNHADIVYRLGKSDTKSSDVGVKSRDCRHYYYARVVIQNLGHFQEDPFSDCII